MVSMLSLSAVDHGFEPLSGKTKDYKIGIYCFYAKHAALSRKSRLVASKSGQCVGVERHVYPQNVVSVS